jgi:hypothetical protein
VDGNFHLHELCADFSETPYPSNNSTEISRAMAKYEAMTILPQKAQSTGSMGLSPQKHHKPMKHGFAGMSTVHRLD